MSLKSFWSNLKFVRKFLSIIAVAVLISTMALFFFVQNEESKNQLAREKKQISVAEGFIATTVKSYFAKIKGFSTLIGSNSEVAEALYYTTLAGDNAALNDLVIKYPDYLDITNLEVVDAKGIIQVAIAHPDEQGKDMSEVQFVKKALTGTTTTGLHKGDGGWAIKGAAPVFNQEELIGALIVGNYISNEYCNYLKAMSGFEVSFIIGNEIIASSISEEIGRQLDEKESARYFNMEESFDRHFGGDRYRLLPIPIVDELDKKVAAAIVGMNLQSADAQAASRIKGVTITLVLVLLIVLFLSYLLARTTVTPLGEMADVVKVVAEGDLTNEPVLESRDEIGLLAADLRLMMGNLRSMIGHTISSSNTIDKATDSLLTEIEATSSSTQSVAGTMETLNKGAESQQKELQLMTSRFSELNSSAQEIAASAETTANSAGDVYKTAEEGGKAVKDAVDVMQVIKNSSGQAVEVVGKLDNEAKKIGNIVEAITSIAEQTNLLALNAAIEAARAGEQGRGFAVVADEVRKLAENSAQSAGEIASLIGGIQSSIAEAVKVIQEGNEKAEKGMEVVNVAGSSLENIITLIRSINDKINDISAAAEEQSASFTEVVSSMENVSQIANTTAVDSSAATNAINDTLQLTDSLKASSTEMKKLARELLEAMSRFKIGQESSSKTGLKPKDS